MGYAFAMFEDDDPAIENNVQMREAGNSSLRENVAGFQTLPLSGLEKTARLVVFDSQAGKYSISKRSLVESFMELRT